MLLFIAFLLLRFIIGFEKSLPTERGGEKNAVGIDAYEI